MRRTIVAALAVTLLAGAGWACATTSGGGGGGGSGESSISFSATRYSADELAAAPVRNLYDFFRRHSRVRIGQTGSRTPLVVRYQGRYVPARLYVDDSEAGNPIGLLRQTRPGDVESLEILAPDEASSIYGGQGRLAVVTLRMK